MKGTCWFLVYIYFPFVFIFMLALGYEICEYQERKGRMQLRGRHSDYYWVEVRKEAEKTELSKSLEKEIRDDR
jgi:hypothetical protein